MGRKKDFQHFILDDQDRPLVGDTFLGQVIAASATTLLDANGNPAWLKNSPDGWRDILVKYGRNTKYWGLFRDFTVPLRFPGDGGLITRNLFWNYGIEAFGKLVVLKNDRTTYPEVHKVWYSGEIDFSKFKQDRDGIPTCNVMEGGVSKYLKAYENTVYEIDVSNDPENFNVLMDGMEMDFNRVHGVMTDQAITGTGGPYYMGLIETSREGLAPGVNYQDIFLKPSSVYPNTDWFNQTDRLQIIRYHGTITLYMDKSVTPIVRIEVNNGINSLSTQYVLYNSPGTAGSTVTFAFDQTITLQPGERAHVKVFGGSPSDSTTQFTVKGGEFKTDYVYTFIATKIKAISLFRLFQKIVEKMTDGKYTVKSDYLSTVRKDIAVTCGDAIRGLPNTKIKTSLTQFFQAVSRWSVGLGIENSKLIIEQISYFFKPTVALDLGVVDITGDGWLSSEDLEFNTIKNGYENQTYNDVAGKYEYNVSQQWTSVVKRITKELNLVCPYRTDAIGAELLRLNLDQKKTTDNSGDNDTFMLNIETTPQPPVTTVVSFLASGNIMLAQFGQTFIVGQSISITGSASNNGIYQITSLNNILFAQVVGLGFAGTLVDEANVTVQIEYLQNQVYKLNRPAYTSVTGIPHPASAYNIELSPKRTLLNNGPLIRSLLDKLDNTWLAFQSGDKNSDLSTTLSGVTIAEREAVQVGTLGDKLFLPYYVNISTSVPLNLQQLMKDSPYEQIKFSDKKGNIFYGFLCDGGIKPATNDKQNWKLLASPQNDLLKLINR